VQAVSFAEMLDAALGRVAAGPARAAVPARATWAGGGAPQAPASFLFSRPLTAAVPRWPAASATTPRLADHAFSDDERRAFNRLLDLGARLEANFSADELRREYRRLAQRYHPDRHSGGSDVEQGSLARTFAELTERYRCLRALVEPRH
jgi:DnaJ domain